MSERAINGFMGISMEKIRSLVDANTIIGNPISCGEGVTIIPVSTISVGFASGGSDLPTRTQKEYFAGGAGGGMSVKPVSFIVVRNGEVEMQQLTMNADKSNVLIEKLPELIDKISEMLKKGKNAKELPESAEKV
ncbi:MAG: sporulation protein YtfJ [Oscillospiraceae bacterium]|nr:sporulation protein YtfJ [Oscillospiraceae bacterium]